MVSRFILDYKNTCDYLINNSVFCFRILLFILFAIVVVGSFYEGRARYKTKEEYNKITSTMGRFSLLKQFKMSNKIRMIRYNK